MFTACFAAKENQLVDAGLYGTVAKLWGGIYKMFITLFEVDVYHTNYPTEYKPEATMPIIVSVLFIPHLRIDFSRSNQGPLMIFHSLYQLLVCFALLPNPPYRLKSPPSLLQS